MTEQEQLVSSDRIDKEIYIYVHTNTRLGSSYAPGAECNALLCSKMKCRGSDRDPVIGGSHVYITLTYRHLKTESNATKIYTNESVYLKCRGGGHAQSKGGGGVGGTGAECNLLRVVNINSFLYSMWSA